MTLVLIRKNIQKIIKGAIFLVLFFSFAFPFGNGWAKQEQPDKPVYIVQEGDSLWDIAARFRVSIDDLAEANGIQDLNQLSAGMQLIIPGLEGVNGILETQTIGFGENLRSITRRNQISLDAIEKLNHLTTPAELYVGSTMVLPTAASVVNLVSREAIKPGQSVLEMAVLTGSSPWEIVRDNQLEGTVSALPGDVLFIAGGSTEGPGAFPGGIQSAELNPESLLQGKAAEIRLQGEQGDSFYGMLVDKPLNFFTVQAGQYIAMEGIHAMLQPGVYPLVITGTLASGIPVVFSQGVLVQTGDYPFDPVIIVSPETTDPAVTQPEDAVWFALTKPVTPVKQWDGKFRVPVPDEYKDCFPSQFGSRRSYNGSDYKYFHTGLDFCGKEGTDIYAPAAGTVVFAGPMTVRGNATVVDHGWGVYTAYMHQSEILVKVGESVKPGQLIGRIGRTGRATGPHLHFEVWVGGIQVDPMDWLEQVYP